MQVKDNHSGLDLEDYLLLGAILLLPWAFGGVEIWAFRGASFLMVSGAAVALWKRGPAGWGLAAGHRTLWLLPAFLLAAWAAVQLVPLPPAVIRAVSPEADRIYAQAIPGYRGEVVPDAKAILEQRALDEVPEAAGHPLPSGPDPALDIVSPVCLEQRWRTFSVQPSATLEALVWYVALLLAFLTVRQRVESRQRYHLYRGAVFAMAGLLALFAIVQDRSWNGKIYWIRKPSSSPTAFGPYVSPTHFVGVMELCLPWLVGYTWALIRRLGRDGYRDVRFAGAAFAIAVCLVASVASASKAGAVLVLASLLTLGLAGARSWRTRLVVIGLGLVLAGGAVASRMETDLGERVESYLARSGDGYLLEGRLAAWGATAAIVRDFPVTGSGFGSYAEVSPRYTPSGSPRRFLRAHNDYLQLMSDGGVVAAVLAFWLTLGFVSRGARRLRSRSGALSITRLGLALGLVSLSLHALVDFNHQVPANALLFVALGALLVSDRKSSGRKGEP